jgi:hypothetical protein
VCHGGLYAHNIENNIVSHWELMGFQSFCPQCYERYFTVSRPETEERKAPLGSALKLAQEF